MDYIELPRKLIYKDRTDLKEFRVQDEGTINNYLFTQMRKLTLLHCGNAKEIALQCFNNAYYICTLIQLDDFPDLCMDKYEKRLLEVETPFKADVYQASMALTCVLLAAYDDNYKQKDNLVIDSIHHWTSSNKWIGSQCRKSFDDIIKSCNTDGFILPKSEFTPRDIIEVIENFPEINIWNYAEYICERLAQLEDPRQRMYGADKAIARIKDYQRELCEDSEYNPKKDSFKYADNDYSLRDYDYETQVRELYQKSKEAIDYYTEHYPNKENIQNIQQTDSTSTIPGKEVLIAENEQLRQQLAQRVSEIQESDKKYAILKEELEEVSETVKKQTSEQNRKVEELETQVNNLEHKLKEANTLPDTVIAMQRVRMELARKLMELAGIDKVVLEKWGNKDKAGTLMGTLLDIRSSTCKTYLSDPNMNFQYHEKTVKEINNILEALDVSFKL